MQKGVGFEGKVKGWGGTSGAGWGCLEENVEGVKREDRDTVFSDKTDTCFSFKLLYMQLIKEKLYLNFVL